MWVPEGWPYEWALSPHQLVSEHKSWGFEWSAQDHRANASQAGETRNRERAAGANQEAARWLPLGLLREVTHPCYPSLTSNLLPQGCLSRDFVLQSSVPLRTKGLNSNPALGSTGVCFTSASWTGPKCPITMSDCWVTSYPGLRWSQF